MADPIEKDSKTEPRAEDEVSVRSGDDAIIPRGQIDPVYEKKAMVLNRAVGGPNQCCLFRWGTIN